MPNVEEMLRSAQISHQEGRVQDAETAYGKILQGEPNHVEALRLLGLLKLQTGDPQAALNCFNQSLAHDPNHAGLYAHAGDAAAALGSYQQATGLYQEALRREFKTAEVFHNLGLALAKLGQHAAAIQNYQKALDLNANFASAYYNLGVILQDRGESGASIVNYRHALRLRPNHPSTLFNLGVALQQQGELAEARILYGEVLKVKPHHLGALYNLARLLQEAEEVEEASGLFKLLLNLAPEHPQAYYWLGKALHDLWRLDEALSYLQAGIKYHPQSAALYNLLAYVYNNLAQHSDAISACKKALAIKPDFWQAHSNLLVMMHFYLDHNLEEIFLAHQAWSQRHLSESARGFTHILSTDINKRLRVGYVSPNFYRGPVGYFTRPLFAAHDKNQVEIYCYYNFKIFDDVTQQLQSFADKWQNIAGMEDAAAAELIYEDKIDILVDLSGQTADHRLLVFARKPAPIQVTWLDYFDTTGLPSMDYLISDPHHTPPDTAQRFTEKVVRLAETRLCFSPPEFAPDVMPLPALVNGYLTFGSFNRSSKMIPEVVALWARILNEIPNARLILKGGALNDPEAWDKTYAKFADHGIVASRIELRSASAHSEMLKEYGDIDIALDPFPHNGGATTCDALWMGVPVIALRGRDMIGRQSAAMLTNVGLQEFVAESEGEYIAIAKAWQNNFARLAEIRKQLRGNMGTSPLCNGSRFAREMEAAYRTMWKQKINDAGT